jgi:hypothetical protein
MTLSCPIPVGERVGSFRYFRSEDRWEWSDAVAAMHGYGPGQVQPTTALVMSHKHPDDSANVALLIETLSDDGAVIGSQGFYVDLSDFEDGGTVDAAIADFTAHRACIEQAKGILMMTYGISAERAFDILVWRSQETNTKLRRLVLQIIRDFTAELRVSGDVRARADQLLLTAHRRVGVPVQPADSHSDAC